MEPRLEPETPGGRARWQRQRLQRSLRAVARDAGVSACTLSRFERDIGDIGLSGATAVARVLRVSLDWLAGGSPRGW